MHGLGKWVTMTVRVSSGAFKVNGQKVHLSLSLLLSVSLTAEIRECIRER